MHYDYGVVLGLQEQWEAAAGRVQEGARRRIRCTRRPGTTSGQILERGRDFDGAASEYRQAVEARPTFRLARFNLGRMLLVSGDAAQAIAEFEKLQQPRRRRNAALSLCAIHGARPRGQTWLTAAGWAQRRRRLADANSARPIWRGRSRRSCRS